MQNISLCGNKIQPV